MVLQTRWNAMAHGLGFAIIDYITHLISYYAATCIHSLKHPK